MTADRTARETLVVACCDPAAGLLAGEYQRQTGFRMLVLGRSSGPALELLGRGLIHAAGVHFSALGAPRDNGDVVQQRLGGGYSLIGAATWQEGVVVSSRSHGASVRSVLREKLRWIGREEGSGARQCLDEFYDYLRSAAAAAVFRKHGFTVLEPDPKPAP